MKSKQLKLYGREDISGREMQASIIPVCFFIFFITLTFMTASLKLLLSTYPSFKGSDILAHKAPYAVNIIAACAVLLFWIMFFAPAYIGMHDYFIAPVKNKNQNIDIIFDWYSFKKFFIGLKFVLGLILLKAFMLICFCAPSFIIFVFTIKTLFSQGIFKDCAYVILAGACIMLGIGVMCYFCAKQRYAAVPYIAAMNPKVKLSDAIKASKKIMEGKYLNFLLFKLSFFGWFLSCVFLFPLMFVFPYYEQSCTEWIFYTANKQKNKNNT